MATPGVFPSRAQSAPLLTIRVHPEKSIQTQFEDALFKGRHSEAERLLVPLALGAEPPSFADIASRKMDQKEKINAFRFLSQHGFDFDGTDHEGRTALHHVARLGELEPFKWLLQLSPDLSMRDQWGYTALHEVAENRELGQEAIDAWVAANGGLDEVTNKNETALTISCKKGHYEKARALFNSQAAIGIQNNQGYAEFYFALHKGNPDEHPGPYGQLDVAAFNQLALDMIERMNDPNITVAPGHTPLLHIVRWKRINDRDQLINLNPHLLALLKKGARIGDVDPLGDSIFHTAAKRGDQHVVEDLFSDYDREISDEPDQDPAIVLDLLNDQGQTAAQIATDRGHEAIVNILLGQGAQAPR